MPICVLTSWTRLPPQRVYIICSRRRISALRCGPTQIRLIKEGWKSDGPWSASSAVISHACVCCHVTLWARVHKGTSNSNFSMHPNFCLQPFTWPLMLVVDILNRYAFHNLRGRSDKGIMPHHILEVWWQPRLTHCKAHFVSDNHDWVHVPRGRLFQCAPCLCGWVLFSTVLLEQCELMAIFQLT